MSFEDFLNIWDNVSICKKFDKNYKGIRYNGKWDESCSGGTPTG